ncbi:MAG: Fe-S cluster assembly sulfur transfer protein SufU [Gemmatimonadota bacterium]
MADLSQLYQSVILDHNQSPRNCRRMADADQSAEGYNPLCGDQLTVWVRMDGDQIQDISFEGSGCAISKASASMMTQAVKGKNMADVLGLFESFHAMVTGRTADSPTPLGKLAVFSGVSEFPSRVKCASLSWHTLKRALESLPNEAARSNKGTQE